MNLHCNKCPHVWEDDVEEEATYVWCPKCGAPVPLSIALLTEKARQNTPAPPTRPQAPAQELDEGDAETHMAPTMTPPPAGATPTPSGSRPASQPPTQGMSRPPSQPPSAPGRTPTPATRPAPGQSTASAAKQPTFTAGARGAASSAGSASGASAGQSLPKPSSSGASAQSQPRTGSAGKGMDHLIGQTLDGYQLDRQLGAGGMGAVYLAHQISLDRDVAIKILPPKFARNPELVARFTREALSAAQLNHHNIIQVYDVGSSGETHYISMEMVRGRTLGEMIKDEGRLQIDDAAGYVLQAARGLKYAHERGIIHRDIKPANLMVNEHGVVKIADMGLAKMRGVAEKSQENSAERDSQLKSRANVELTSADVAMGTPSYMSPEQARDAANVDERADQYSLGCTLYYLVAGKAPYSGSTAYEIFSKHQTEPLPPIETHVKGVPTAFRAIVEKTLEKDPNDRYPGMGELIKDLEAYLGVESEKGPYTPREKHVAELETQQKAYYAAPSIAKRRLAALAFMVAMPVLILGALFMKNFALAGGFLGLFLLTPLANFIVDGVKRKTFLFRRTRAIFFGMPLRSWAMTVGGALLALAALWVLGWLFFWIAFAVLAAGIAAAYQFGVARPLRAERAGPIEAVQQMLKELRVRGVGEEALQDFVCRFSGEHWEEFFEDLFGYEAMILARGKWAAADKAKPRKRFATWREPIVKWLEEIEEGRKTAREKKQLTKVEAKRLEATGVSEAEARKQAAEAATRIMTEEVKKAPPKPAAGAADVVIGKKAELRSGFDLGFAAFRLALGLGMAAAVAPQLTSAVPVPGFLEGLLEMYYGWGWGAHVMALVGAGGVLASLFSGRRVTHILTTVGALLLAAGHLLVTTAATPQLTDNVAYFGGLLVTGLGLLPAILGKLSGNKF